MRKPGADSYFVRQASGQILFKYRINGQWYTKRVPKRIVFMVDAQTWIARELYGYTPEPSKGQKLVEKLKYCQALHDGATTDGERNAVAHVIELIKQKQSKVQNENPCHC